MTIFALLVTATCIAPAVLLWLRELHAAPHKRRIRRRLRAL